MSSPNMYFEETFKKEKKFRYCLRFLKVSDGDLTMPARQNSTLCLHVDRETKKVHLKESEKKNVRDHLDFVIKKLEKLHKNLIWNINLGHSPIFVSDICPRPEGENNISLLPDKFVMRNPKTWSKATLETMDSSLKLVEFDADGIVCVFALEGDEKVSGGVEEVKRVGLEHLAKVYGMRVWQEKGARRPLERKTPVGGHVVFLAYKLVSSVSTGQILYETLLLGVDLASKKTELCQHLDGLGFTSYTEDRLRRQVDLLPQGLTRDQTRLYQSLVRGWQSQGMINVTLVNCQRKLSSVSRRECLCYTRDK